MDTMDFDGTPIRIVIDDWETWYCLKDICAILGVNDQSQMLARVKFFEKDLVLYGDTGYRRLCELNSGIHGIIATKREMQLMMVRKYSLRLLLKTSTKPLARDMRAWLAGQKRKTERPNQKEMFSDDVNLYYFTDRTYGLRMAAKILHTDLEIFARWVEEGYLHPDKHTPQEKYDHLFYVKHMQDENLRVHFQVFLTEEGFTFFRQPRNRPTLPPKTIPLD